MQNVTRRTPIIGFVRYSQKVKFGNQEIERNVFEPEYFEYRFNIFKEVTLKSFQQQTNSDFVLLLLHSENMPEDYKKRFLELENENIFLRNVFVQDTQGSFDEAISRSFQYISFQENVAITFRIDNDDAVPNNFIENLGLFLNPSFVGSCLNLPYILIVKRVKTDQYLVETRYYPSNSIGLAYVTTENKFKTILEVNHHHLINEKTNLILLAKDSGMPIQTINGENEVNSVNESASKSFTEKTLQDFFKGNNYENINLKCLKVLNNKKTRSLKDMVFLFTPPIVKTVALKVKSFITEEK